MNLAYLCRGDAITISEEASIQEAALLMLRRSVGLLVVTKDQNPLEPIGVVTDRDIVTLAVAPGCSTATERVKTIMSSDLATLPECAETEDALKLMKERGVRRVVILDGNGRIGGVVAVDDIMRRLSRQFSRITELLDDQVPIADGHRVYEFTQMA